MMSPSLFSHALFRGIPDPVPPRLAIAEFGKCLRSHQLQPLRGVVAMDFLHIELAHEVDGLLGDDLAGHHDRETGRIRNDEACRYQLWSVLQPSVDLDIGEVDELA